MLYRYPIIRLSLTITLVLLVWLGNMNDSLGGVLTQRLQEFPAWYDKPPVKVASGDLIYPDWIKGNWQVTSTLIEQVAPLAPDIITPGFAANSIYLDQPIEFEVRFIEKINASPSILPSIIRGKLPVVADRSFNGLKISQAYLGEDGVLGVKVDPGNPNRQVSFFPGDRQLISTVTSRITETPTPEQYITTEVTQQIFRNESQIYFNEVETTTFYELINPEKIEAQQITAIYLSPQDPDYFQAAGRPVALYRYHLELSNNK